MILSEIGLRDPYIFADKASGWYYLYGSMKVRKEQTYFKVYKSRDLVEWDDGKVIFSAHDGFWGTTHFWAPELHLVDGRYYLFATFAEADERNRCQILTCDRPDGTFEVYEGPTTPEGWSALDGTYYESDGKRYCIFCREWKDVINGEMCLMEMDEKLRPVGKVETLFAARDAAWVVNASKTDECYVTDGPFIITCGKTFFMTWSSFSAEGYAVAYAKADDIHGPWIQQKEPLLNLDCGHGMIFEDFEGRYKLVCHCPNSVSEHPVIYDVTINEDEILVNLPQDSIS